MKFIFDSLNALTDLPESVAWKSLIMLALIFAAMIFLRRNTAALRHWVWTAAFVCLLFLPVFVRCFPAWQPPAWTNALELNNRLPNLFKFDFENVSPTKNLTGDSTVSANKSKTVSSTSQNPAEINVAKNASHLNRRGLAALIWLIGMMIALARILATQIYLRQMTRKMTTCENSLPLKILENLRRDYQIKYPVKLLVSKISASPMTWGFWRPVVSLPTESVHWPDERLRVVLAHELAHIKRRDCLTQGLAQLACTFYWFNPLAWLAARQMRAEREKACDDFVLNAGARPAEYANHLVEIARQFSAAQLTGAVAMARPSGLESRVIAILDAGRNRNVVGKITAVFIAVIIFGLGFLIGGCSDKHSPARWSLEHSIVSARLKSFVTEKEVQEDKLLALDANDYFKQGDVSKLKVPDCRPFFAAAAKGDWLAVSNQFQELQRTTTNKYAVYPHGRWRGPVMETYGAMEAFATGDEKYSKLFGDEIIQSIPDGSIYFGATDAGRFIVTALQKSHANGEPFFTLTQNALADQSYLDYLHSMYDEKIYIPTPADAQKAFQVYMEDAQRRLNEHKLKPGEDVKVTEGRVQISGYVSVMEINGLLVKKIFDENPKREFYIEESFPLDWLYPYLEPHGLILKINRQPLAELSDEMIQRDHDYWTKMVSPMIGDWLKPDTSVQEVAAFAEKVFARHDFSGFSGDPEFVLNAYAHKMFSKERNSIAGLYAWRAQHATSDVEKKRLQDAADFAFRQSWALCPYSSETVFNYVTLLMSQNRRADALLIAETATKMSEVKGNDGEPLRQVVKQLKDPNTKFK